MLKHEKCGSSVRPLCTLPCARFHSNESANYGLQESTNQILEISSLPSSYLENSKVKFKVFTS
jgi:hypothetical protein